MGNVGVSNRIVVSYNQNNIFLMKYWLTFFLTVCFSMILFAQKIEIKEGIAYVNDKAYVKIEKKNKRKYIIKDLKDDAQLLKVKIVKEYQAYNKKTFFTTKLNFSGIEKKVTIKDQAIQNEKELIAFLYKKRLFSYKGKPNSETLVDQYKRISVLGSCDKILKNDFSDVHYDNFVTNVKNDTMVLTEVKYKCVYSAFYTKKAMYDRYGKWHKAIAPHQNPHKRNLIWSNIKLLKDVDVKFTVITRGHEGRKTIYTSMIVLDEKGRDMLAKNAPYREELVALFGNYIRNNFPSRKFYEAYWTTFDPARWKQIQEHKQSKNRKKQYPLHGIPATKSVRKLDRS